MNAQAELLFRGLDASDMAVMCIDPVADQVLECNATLSDLCGFTQDQILSLPVSILFANQFPSLVAFSQACMEKKNSYTNELSLICADDTTRSVEVYGSVFEDQGRVLLLFTLFDTHYCHKLRLDADATRYHRGGLMEWKRIEEVFSEFERENQLILNAAGEGIYGVNTEGVTTFVNPAGEKMLGYAAAELVGRNAHECIHHSHEDGSCYQMQGCPIYAAFHDGIVHQVGDEVFWRKDGSSFPVEYTSTPIEDQGRVVGAVVIFRDVSERREADRRLRAALSEVESLKRRLELENAYLQDVVLHSDFIFPNTFSTITEIRTVSFSQILSNTTGSIEMGIVCLAGLALVAGVLALVGCARTSGRYRLALGGDRELLRRELLAQRADDLLEVELGVDGLHELRPAPAAPLTAPAAASGP